MVNELFNNKNIYIFPCNLKLYNCEVSFLENKNKVDWHTRLTKIKKDDIVLIYYTKPVAKIKLICKVIDSNINNLELIRDDKYWKKSDSKKEHKRYIRLELLKILDKGISLEELKENGLTGNIQGSCGINDEKNVRLKKYIIEELSKQLEIQFEEENFIFDNYVYESNFNDTTKSKIEYITVTGTKIKRDSRKVMEALRRANYSCELDSSHKTFARKKDGLDYTEAHHLIPLSAQDDFNESLDITANIVSLCPNCHKEIHYGNSKKMIKKLYDQRIIQLQEEGIQISLEELLSYYK